MPRLRSGLPLALLLGLTAFADGPGTTTPLRSEIDARLAAGGFGERKTDALEAMSADLADDASLADEADSARRSSNRVRRVFRGDTTLRGLLGGSADAIAATADTERAALGPALPGLAEPEAALLRDGFADVARLLGYSVAERTVAGRLSYLARACRRLDKARLASGAVPVPGEAPRPEFSLRDVNLSSDSWHRRVSPRTRLGSVSAWYFGHST